MSQSLGPFRMAHPNTRKAFQHGGRPSMPDILENVRMTILLLAVQILTNVKRKLIIVTIMPQAKTTKDLSLIPVIQDILAI